MSVVLHSNDLAVFSRVEGAAARLGMKVRSAAAAQSSESDETDPTQLQILDLSSPSLNITAVVEEAHTSTPAPVRVVAFGPHVHAERLAAAQEAGCDLVVTRGQFFSQLDTILSQH